MGKLLIAFCGNHRLDCLEKDRFTSECHIATTLEQLGHSVLRLQEDKVSQADIMAACRGSDFFLWTKTAQWLKCNGFELLKRIPVPTVGLHADLWWGLEREREIRTSPFFKCRYVFTADGGSQDKFKAAGVNHFWLRPGVLKSECYLAEPRKDLLTDIGFCGSRSYHKEHYRTQLIDWMREQYVSHFRLFGANGDSWRGSELNQLYRSVKVMVGDSCFAGRCRNYVSDRLYESCGRGAALVFPHIEGITQDYIHGTHLFYYQPGNFNDLHAAICTMLALPEEKRLEMRKAAIAHTLAHHTWNHRMIEMLGVIAQNEPAIAARLAE